MLQPLPNTSSPVSTPTKTGPYRTCEFSDNMLVQQLVGPHNANLSRLEQRFGVVLHSRGNTVAIEGPPENAALTEIALTRLYDRLTRGLPIDEGDVDGAARMAVPDDTQVNMDLSIRTRKRHISPRSRGQAKYLHVLNTNELVFALGPAGTGKTYLAVAKAVAMKLAGQVDRIILSRPAVEAGERLGFLPGDMREKVDPYLRPLYDALHEMLPGDQVAKLLLSGDIEVAPLAFMRGRTLSNAFIILDEAQNTTAVQMKMALTRMGENARMVVTGDLSQIDLPAGAKSGLADALDTLKGISEIAAVTFTSRDVVRHDLVAQIVSAYDARDTRQKAMKPPR
ncbi:MAG: phosphate starvation-inducible protein PhoH [Candidatus Marinimicrobia bacterium]|nr:phosphate starvation-inducible protein PhoH [Candidatus Neomarinimicrobiota bacterium]